MSRDICVFYLQDDITLFHTLFPLLTSVKYKKQCFFTSNLDYVINRSKERILILFRYFKRRDIIADESIYEKFRDRFDRVIYFDDNSSADGLNVFALPYVDVYFKKQIYKDLSLYTRDFYGKRYFSDYYHQKNGIIDDPEKIRPAISEQLLSKIHLSWNLGIGCYPKSRLRKAIVRRTYPLLGLNGLSLIYNKPEKYRVKKSFPINKISARYGTSFDINSVKFHRDIYQKKVMDSDLFLTGKVPLKQYNDELKNVFATFSPFGWGEVCFRDFEAIINKSVLIKPSMDHIETWPNVYVNDETYLPVDWDGTNLLEKAEMLLDSSNMQEALAENAYDVYITAFSKLNKKLDDFFEIVYEGI